MPLSPSPGHPLSLVLDRSQSAPAYMRQAVAPTPGQSQSQTEPGFQGLPIPWPSSQAQNTAPTAQQSPLSGPSPTNPTQPLLSTITTPPALSTCSPPANKMVTGTPTLGGSATEIGCASEKAGNSSLFPHPEESLTTQPMEQEEDMSDTITDHRTCLRTPLQQSEGSFQYPHQPISNPLSLTLEPCPFGSTSTEMKSPPASSQNTVPSERDQPEGKRCSYSDQIPSLAQALLELHELLVSNSRSLSTQDRSASCSPSHRQNADGLDDNHNPTIESRVLTPENTTQPSPSTAITAGAEPCDAKANHPAAVSDRGPPPDCVLQGSSDQEPSLETRTEAEPGEGHGEPEPQCPNSSWGERRADGYGLDTSKSKGTVSEAKGPSSLQTVLVFREPPEGQQGRGVADGRASGNDNPNTLNLQPDTTQQSPLSMAAGSPGEESGVSPRTTPLPQAPDHPSSSSPATLFSAPRLFTDDHIQRIQAAGFSAREAAEALEQAQGSVELALLALLARKITVPT